MDEFPSFADGQPVEGEWVFVFEALESPYPVANRVKALLKRALRDWKLKCVHVGHRLPLAPKRKKEKSSLVVSKIAK